jgi:hypothetical protein
MRKFKKPAENQTETVKKQNKFGLEPSRIFLKLEKIKTIHFDLFITGSGSKKLVCSKLMPINAPIGDE